MSDKGECIVTAEELFSDFGEKYDYEFQWHLIPLTNQYFVSELKREIGVNHFLYHTKIWAVAKCDSNDDVLFVTAGNGESEEIYYLFHLTYSDSNMDGYPKYKKFIGIEKVKEYMENELSNQEGV